MIEDASKDWIYKSKRRLQLATEAAAVFSSLGGDASSTDGVAPSTSVSSAVPNVRR